MNRFKTAEAQKQRSTLTDRQNQQGFTLIELSIVLVIIGLIVGGVLVGQDLIKAAEIRATISQLEKYNTAANTFRSKYNGLPGDLLNPTNYGSMVATCAATPNGNDLVEGAAQDGTAYGCETAAFWYDLSVANLVDGNYNTAAVATPAAALSPVSTFTPAYSPPAKLGKGNYVLVGGVGTGDTVINNITQGFNYWFITGPVSADSSGILTVNNTMTPSEAYQIDVKTDDGVPTKGTVEAVDTFASTFVLSSGGGACNNGGIYNFSTATANKALCTLVVRSDF